MRKARSHAWALHGGAQDKGGRGGLGGDRLGMGAMGRLVLQGHPQERESLSRSAGGRSDAWPSTAAQCSKSDPWTAVFGHPARPRLRTWGSSAALHPQRLDSSPCHPAPPSAKVPRRAEGGHRRVKGACCVRPSGAAQARRPERPPDSPARRTACAPLGRMHLAPHPNPRPTARPDRESGRKNSIAVTWRLPLRSEEPFAAALPANRTTGRLALARGGSLTNRDGRFGSGYLSGDPRAVAAARLG